MVAGTIRGQELLRSIEMSVRAGTIRGRELFEEIRYLYSIRMYSDIHVLESQQLVYS